MKKKYPRAIKRSLWLPGLLALFTAGSGLAQNQAIGFKKGMPFSEASAFCYSESSFGKNLHLC